MVNYSTPRFIQNFRLVFSIKKPAFKKHEQSDDLAVKIHFQK